MYLNLQKVSAPLLDGFESFPRPRTMLNLHNRGPLHQPNEQPVSKYQCYKENLRTRIIYIWPQEKKNTLNI